MATCFEFATHTGDVILFNLWSLIWKVKSWQSRLFSCVFSRPVCWERGHADDLRAGCERRARVFQQLLLCPHSQLCALQIPCHYSPGRVFPVLFTRTEILWKVWVSFTGLKELLNLLLRVECTGWRAVCSPKATECHKSPFLNPGHRSRLRRQWTSALQLSARSDRRIRHQWKHGTDFYSFCSRKDWNI